MKKILIIEDSIDLQKLYQIGLRPLGAELIACLSGREAVEKIKNENLELVIMDLTLADISIEEFAPIIRDLLLEKMMPLIILSGRDDVHDWGEHLGAEAALAKPVEMSQLLEEAEKALRRVETLRSQVDLNFLN